jgi:hypothetical protein
LRAEIEQIIMTFMTARRRPFICASITRSGFCRLRMIFNPGGGKGTNNPDLNPSHSGSVFRLAVRLLPL